MNITITTSMTTWDALRPAGCHRPAAPGHVPARAGDVTDTSAATWTNQMFVADDDRVVHPVARRAEDVRAAAQRIGHERPHGLPVVGERREVVGDEISGGDGSACGRSGG